MFVAKSAAPLSRVSSSLLLLQQHGRSSAVGAIRHLNVHEYISMEIMKTHGIATPECHVASTADEVEHIFSNSFSKRAYTTTLSLTDKVLEMNQIHKYIVLLLLLEPVQCSGAWWRIL
jgi:hypothetical protein